jgi:predicted nucleotidyltransferase
VKLKDDFLDLTPGKVTEALERIVADCQPTSILVFGSRARGEAHADSDLDLLVLLPAPPDDRFALRQHLRGLLADMPFSKDILVSDPLHLAEYQTRLNSVYYAATEDGFPLWQNGKLDPAAIEAVCRHKPVLA